MIRALYSAASGMSAQEMSVDNIAHNLANANTVGFKARQLQFQDLLYQTVVQPGAAAGSQTVTIAPDGTVSCSVPGQTAAQNGGQIQLATFQNAAGLNSLGRNLYSPTDASGDPTVGNPGGQEGMGPLLQGYTEQSNVSVVDEFVQLIMSQRAYEANSRVVRAADEMYQKINTMTS